MGTVILHVRRNTVSMPSRLSMWTRGYRDRSCSPAISVLRIYLFCVMKTFLFICVCANKALLKMHLCGCEWKHVSVEVRGQLAGAGYFFHHVDPEIGLRSPGSGTNTFHLRHLTWTREDFWQEGVFRQKVLLEAKFVEFTGRACVAEKRRLELLIHQESITPVCYCKKKLSVEINFKN